MYVKSEITNQINRLKQYHLPKYIGYQTLHLVQLGHIHFVQKEVLITQKYLIKKWPKKHLHTALKKTSNCPKTNASVFEHTLV